VSQKKKTVAISGGFDPIHIGHIRMIRDSANHGEVIVILNTDEWLRRKKGYCFMPFDQRKEIIESIKGVKSVVSAIDDDGTVCKSLESIEPDFFANGGDRINTNTPEIQICKKYGIELLWNIGGNKIQSSSELVEKQRIRAK
jgi:D-beta-D-heptose 7-phosphate kinase/D-beta-D-heptose 1-phosphate adenosyltransferase